MIFLRCVGFFFLGASVIMGIVDLIERNRLSPQAIVVLIGSSGFIGFSFLSL